MVKVQAQVKVTPLVKHGTPRIYCVDPGANDWDCCDWDFSCGDRTCDFNICQIMCIEIPICFDAAVDIKKGIGCCDQPGLLPCCRNEWEACGSLSDQIRILLSNKVQF